MDQTKGLKRNTIDKFYTNTKIAEKCVELARKYLTPSSNDLFIEPSAGNGSFIGSIKKMTQNSVFYDLEPDNDEIIKQDFLELDCSKFKKEYDKIHIIGNPPFGCQSSMAIKFIKKCCNFSDSISFILPKSFKKDSMKKHFNKNFHLIYECDLDDYSFLINGIKYDVPCVFQIWIRRDDIRIEQNKINPFGFVFVNKYDNPDISFRRIGVNAGTITREINNKSIQSHYFIRFTNDKTIDDNIENLKQIKFECNNTVGPKSISKQELIKEFNHVLV